MNRGPVAPWVWIAVAIGVLAALSSYALSLGSHTSLVLAIAFAAAPIAVYAILRAPFIFPLGLYVALIPINDLLAIPRVGTVTAALGMISAAAIVLYALRTKQFMSPARSVFTWLLLVLFSASSLAWAIDLRDATPLLLTLFELFVLYAILCSVRVDDSSFRFLLHAAAIGASITCIYAIYLFSHGVDVDAGRLLIRDGPADLDPNQFATEMLLPIAIVLTAYARNTKWPIKFLLAAQAIVLAAGVYLSGSRGGMVATAALVAYLIWRSRHRAQFTFLSILGVLAAATFGAGPITRFVNAINGGGSGRSDIWRVGAIAFREHWLFGAGVGNFPNAYDRAFIQAFQPIYQGWGRAPHNLLLGTGVELGIIGLGIMIAAWWVQFRILRFVKPSDPRFEWRVMFEASVVGMFVAALFLDVMYRKQTWLLFSLMGMLACMVRRPREQTQAPSPPPHSPIRSLRPPAQAIPPPPRAIARVP